MVCRKRICPALLVIGVVLLCSLTGCQKNVPMDPFQEYLDSLKHATGIIVDVDYQVTLRAEGRNMDYEKVDLSESGPVNKDVTEEEYQRIKEENQKILEGFVGELFAKDGGKEFYRIKDHGDIRYLIRKTPKGELSVWEFKRFKVFYIENPYLYGDALTLIYHVNSADDIRQIVFLPPTFDHTEDGKAVQKEIGTTTVKNRSDVEAIYQVLKGMECYGAHSLGREDLPCCRDNTIREMNTAHMGNARKYRELRIDLKNGSSITGLKYSATWGGFYENDGVAYHDLMDEQAALINRLAKIKTE